MTAIVQRAKTLAKREPLPLPAVIVQAGRKASTRFIESFTAEIRNKNTRAAYLHAVTRFFDWCGRRGLRLDRLQPVVVAAYIEDLGRHASPPTVKQHLAAIRMVGDYVVVGQVLPFNPATSVRGPKHVVKSGKTPVLTTDEARGLFESIDVDAAPGRLVALRDRALLGLMTYSFARVGTVVRMNVRDYQTQGRRARFRLHEKGGKFHQVPAHHKAAEYLDAYLAAARIDVLREARAPENTVWYMVKRRAHAARLSPGVTCHTFRATGITAFLKGGGELATAQRIANHESPRTAALYDRRAEEIDLDEIERIRL